MAAVHTHAVFLVVWALAGAPQVNGEVGFWAQVGRDIDGEAPGDQSGDSVALSADGTRLAVGARFNDGAGANSGHVRVYRETAGAWTQVGRDIDGEAPGDQSGWSVALSAGDQSGDSVALSADGTRLAVGARFNDGAGANSGHVRVYREPTTTMTSTMSTGATSTATLTTRTSTTITITETTSTLSTATRTSTATQSTNTLSTATATTTSTATQTTSTLSTATRTSTATQARCVDDNSATDWYGYSCSSWMYTQYQSYCGYFDDDDFTAAEQCCACGGDQTTEVLTTSTSTTTTTVTMQPMICTATHMMCPIPAAYVSSRYKILGSEGVAACQIQGPVAAPYFKFVVTECNVTRVVDAERKLVTRTATLMPVVTRGSLVLMKDPVMPILVCICTSPMTGEAGNGVLTEPVQPKIVEVRGKAQFEPVLEIFPNNSFRAPLLPGEVFPATSGGRYYVQVRSAAPDDIIGLERCTASPSGRDGDPFAEPLLKDSCPVGILALEWHNSSSLNSVRVSVPAFRFTDMDQASLRCTVIRCGAQEPCGVCEAPTADPRRRRLAAADRRLVELRIHTSGAGVVLPAPVRPERLRTVWEASPATWPVVEALGGNLSLYGCNAEPGYALARALAGAIAKCLHSSGNSEVRLLRFRVLARAPRRLGAGSRRAAAAAAGLATTDVLAAEFALPGVPAAAVLQVADDMTALSLGGARAVEFADVVRSELAAAGFQGMGGLRAAFGPLAMATDPEAPLHTTPPPAGGTGVPAPAVPGRGIPRLAEVVAAAVAAVVLIGCAALLCCWRRLQPGASNINAAGMEESGDGDSGGAGKSAWAAKAAKKLKPEGRAVNAELTKDWSRVEVFPPQEPEVLLVVGGNGNRVRMSL